MCSGKLRDGDVWTSILFAVENKSYFAKLKRDEIPVNAADRATAVYEDEDDGSGDGVGDDNDKSDDADEGGEPRMSREHHKQVQVACK